MQHLWKQYWWTYSSWLISPFRICSRLHDPGSNSTAARGPIDFNGVKSAYQSIKKKKMKMYFICVPCDAWFSLCNHDRGKNCTMQLGVPFRMALQTQLLRHKFLWIAAESRIAQAWTRPQECYLFGCLVGITIESRYIQLALLLPCRFPFKESQSWKLPCCAEGCYCLGRVGPIPVFT